MSRGELVQLIRFEGQDAHCEICGEKIFTREGEPYDFSKLMPDAYGMAQAMMVHLPMHQPIEIELYLETLRAQARIKAEEQK